MQTPHSFILLKLQCDITFSFIHTGLILLSSCQTMLQRPDFYINFKTDCRGSQTEKNPTSFNKLQNIIISYCSKACMLATACCSFLFFNRRGKQISLLPHKSHVSDGNGKLVQKQEMDMGDRSLSAACSVGSSGSAGMASFPTAAAAGVSSTLTSPGGASSTSVFSFTDF